MSETEALCRAIEADLSALLDGEFDASREALLRAHLATCAACARRMAVLDSVDTVLRGVAQAADPVDAARQERIRQGILARARDQAPANPASESLPFARRRAPRRRRSVTLLAAASIAAGVAGLVLLVARPVSTSEPAVVAKQVSDAAQVTPLASEVIAAAEQRVAAQQGPDAFAASGASAPAEAAQQDLPSLESASNEELELAAALLEMERDGTSAAAPAAPIRERIAALTISERDALQANVARWRAMSADERTALRERWRRFRERPAEP